MASVLQERARAAAIHQIERMGWEVIEGDWESFIVATDVNGWLVFTYPKAKRGAMPGDIKNLRGKFEQAAANYLAEYNPGAVPMRCDVFKMNVVADDRAMLRHEVNVLRFKL